MASKLTLIEVNDLDYDTFISVFGSVLEYGQLASAYVWDDRPFCDSNALCEAFSTFIRNLSVRGKRALVRCHPDLAGKLSAEGSLSKESMEEQKLAGLLDLTDKERRELSLLNSRYKNKFSFPFVVCARENKKETIKRELNKRVGNTEEDELINAVEQIVKIASYRIRDIIVDAGPSNL